MAGKNLMKLQAGKQTAFATPVIDTVRMMGIEDMKFTPIRDSERLKELRGSMAPSFKNVLKRLGATGMIKGYETYQDAPFRFDSVMGIIAPTGSGPYVRAYAAPLVAVTASPRIHTFYYGEAVDGINKFIGGVCTKLHYSAKEGELLRFDQDFLGYNIVSGASFASLSDRTESPITAGDMSVAIDAYDGTIGSTVFAGNVYDMDLVLEPGKRDARHYLGSLLPQRVVEPDRWDFTLKLTLEYVAASPNSKALADEITALTTGATFEKQVRLSATDGAGIWQVDLAGTLEKGSDHWSYQEGVETFVIELKGIYNAALGNFLKASSANAVAALAM